MYGMLTCLKTAAGRSSSYSLPGGGASRLGADRCCVQARGMCGTFLILFQHPFHAAIQEVFLADAAEAELKRYCDEGSRRTIQGFGCDCSGRSRTCGTTRCGPPLRISWSSGCQRGSSWRGRTRSASAHPHSAHARSSQSRPLRNTSGKNDDGTKKTTKKADFTTKEPTHNLKVGQH